MQDFLEDDTNSKFYLGDKGVKFVTNEKNIKKRYSIKIKIPLILRDIKWAVNMLIKNIYFMFTFLFSKNSDKVFIKK